MPSPFLGEARARSVGNFFGILLPDRYRQNAGLDLGTPVVVTYTILDRDQLPTKDSLPYKARTLEAMSRAQAEGVRDALAEFEAEAGIRFVEVSDGGQFAFHAVTGSDYLGWAYYPRGDGRVQPVVLDNDTGRIARGTHGFEVALHEIGHAVGLKHPHEGPPLLFRRLDDQSHTIMTYNDERKGHDLGTLDEQALDYLYGGPSGGELRIRVAGEAMKVSGSRGDDTLGIAAYTMAANLGGGDDTGFLGRRGGKIDGSFGADTLTGARGNDTLIGNSGDDVLDGGTSGRDSLYGGRDDDRLTAFVRSLLDGGSGDDTLEAVRGTLIGGEGDDAIIGGGGVRAGGGGGNDAIIGGRWANLAGDAGDDRLRAGSRSVLDGGDGDDRLSAITGTRPDGDFDDGSYCRLFGGDGADTLTSLRHGVAEGGDGDDFLIGQYSALSGGAGNDTLTAAVGSRIDGGAGNDVIDLTGGQGECIVSFTPGSGRDTVEGFRAYDPWSGSYARTRIDVEGFGLDAAALVAKVRVVGADLVLDLGGGNALVLSGAADTPASLANFV